MLSELTLDEAVDVLGRSGVIAFPTETSFGLGCRAYDSMAVARVVAAKGRPDGKPLPILLPDKTYLAKHGMETPLMALAERFWPGALTLVVPAFPGLPSQVTAGTNMVGVRVSSHPIAHQLVQALGEPIVGTSANLTGRPAAYSSAELLASGLDGLDGFLNGQTSGRGASTVVGMADGQLTFFRDGPITRTDIEAAWQAARRS
ncbi:MAG: L-threonylcarbamoyladenylate synthase [Myxococcota bacterium]|nr:L-threonylcarbamoyladenylate synthase [Myxococcota bacterium]